MANLDLMSYERDSRWQPHLSWAYPDLTLQQRMQQQAAQREQAWQKIADKLGPLLIGSDIGGSYGQSDYISRDICEDQDYLERAYEKAPLLSSAKCPGSSSTIRNQKNTSSNSRSTSNHFNNNNDLNSPQDRRINNFTSQHNQTRNNRSNQQTGQKSSNLNLYAQQHYVQMPQRGHHVNHIKHNNNNSYHNSGSQLFMWLSVLLFMLLLLLFSLLLFFFYFNN